MTTETKDVAGELEAAWSRAWSAAPAGWCISVTQYPPGSWDTHATAWNFQGGVSKGVVDGFGPTPAAALHALAVNLRLVRSGSDRQGEPG